MCDEDLVCRSELKSVEGLSGNLKKCLDSLVSEGDVCYQSTPNFKSGVRQCETGLVCRYMKETQNPPPGTPRICLKPILSEGQLCYRATPEFKDGPRQCSQGLICRPQTNDSFLPGSGMKCLKPEEKLNFLE